MLSALMSMLFNTVVFEDRFDSYISDDVISIYGANLWQMRHDHIESHQPATRKRRIANT